MDLDRVPNRDVLPEDVWQQRKSAHEARVDQWIAPILQRHQRRERHPVEDFLFTYYSYRPGQLRRWSPGGDVTLEGAAPGKVSGRHWTFTAAGAKLAPAPPRVARTAAMAAEVLETTSRRAPQFGCFGLHEWAMVYAEGPDGIRHRQWPLRLGSSGTDEVVRSLPVRCSHFDAFRFFSPAARSLNVVQPTREARHELEQGGCLHANMDLYKWAYKLSPWVRAELVADCFDLALRVRVLDMRASPYDLTGLGYPPVRIETIEGRREYADSQRAFAAQAGHLRAQVTSAARRLVHAEAG